MHRAHYHVTEACHADLILEDGFFGSYGDIGFGVFFWSSLAQAQAYAKKGGWDGTLQQPVILKVNDPWINRVTQADIHPDWDQDLYIEMAWYEMDEDEPETLWMPAQISCLALQDSKEAIDAA